MASGVELQGVDEMMAAIQRKLASGVQRLENQGMRAAGEIFAEGQRENVPVSSIEHLHMRDDIRVSPVRRVDGLRVVSIGPSKKTSWRAHWSEFGSINNTAHPFIYPSFHENKDRVTKLLAGYMTQGVTDG